MIKGDFIRSTSIICPVFNLSERLARLEKWIKEVSVCPQFEIIIVHDYSDGKNGSELESICKQYKNVLFIDGHFGNPGSARNAGLKIAQGTRVTFWDCDDEPNVANFSSLIESSKTTNPDICFGSYTTLNEKSGSKIDSPCWSDSTEKNLKIVAQNPGIWRIVFARDLLEGIAFQPLRMAEDQIFICEAVLKARSIEFQENRIYTYCTGSPGHLTSNPMALQDLLPALKKTIQMLETCNNDMVFFPSFMAARQFASGLKYGNFRTRLALLILVSRSKLLIRSHFLNSIKILVKNLIQGF